MTVAIRRALEERLQKTFLDERSTGLLHDMAISRQRWSSLQILDDRSADSIMGYDENGLPG